VSSGSLNFQAFTQELDFAVSNLGDQPVSVEVTADAPWLGVTPVNVDGEGLGQYRAMVSRTGLADGSHHATITVTPDDPLVGNRTIAVIVLVTSPDLDADAGQHYVILVPPDANESVVAQLVTAANGEYAFALQDVPPGDYQLFAGTDLDDDGFICDGGEACGAYPSLATPGTITVDARVQPQITDQSFASEFRTTATTTTVAANAAGEPGPGIRVSKHRSP
jgi:serine protease